MTEVKTFRIDKALAGTLKKAARRLDRKPNWIVNAALADYLARLEREDMEKEARRQAGLLHGDSDNWEVYTEWP